MKKTLVTVALSLALSSLAFAQQKSAKEELVGAWTLVSVSSEMDDGTKGEPFGPSPKGIIIFSNDGHFSLFHGRICRTKVVPEILGFIRQAECFGRKISPIVAQA